MFGWCQSNQHDKCIREFEQFYFEQRKGKSVIVKTGEIVYCECSKRGCKCFVKAADRKKTKTTRRKT